MLELGPSLFHEEVFLVEERRKERDQIPRPSRKDLNYPRIMSGMDTEYTLTDDTGINLNIAGLSRNMSSGAPGPLPPKVPPVEADWERSTVSTSSYISSAGSSGTRTSLPSLPTTLETIDDMTIRKAMMSDQEIESSSRMRFNDKQLDDLAHAYFYDPDDFREHRWSSIAEEIGQNWQDVEFNVRATDTCFA